MTDWQREHDRAAAIARAASRAVLETIRDAVDRAIADGLSIDQFRAQLTIGIERP